MLIASKEIAAFGGFEFAAHFGDAAEKMPMPGRCGHLLFAFPQSLFSRRFHLCLIDTADGLARIAIVAGTSSSLVHNILLKFLQLRERVVRTKIQFPRISCLLRNYIHTDGFIRVRGRVAFPNNGKAIVARNEAGLGPCVHRVHHDRAIVYRDVFVSGDDECDLASLIELHLMHTRTRAQGKGSHQKEKEGKLSHVM